MTDAAPLNSTFAPIFPGWNVWQVYQVQDLPFSISMFGVSRDRQLSIWVEDELRLHSGADVADPLDLKGSQVEIIADPNGLVPAARREDGEAAAYVVSGPADLRTVRFFNKAGQTTIAWPHDDSYMLEAVYEPKADNPATSGPPPTTIAQTVGKGVTQPIGDLLGEVPWYVWAGAAVIGGSMLLSSVPATAVRKASKVGKRV